MASGSGERAGRAPEDLARVMRRLVRAAERLESAAMAAGGLPRAQGQALIAIGTMARPTMAMLARELDLAPSTGTRLLDPLVRRDLVRRESDPKDRRVVVVSLTAAGRRLARELESALDRAYARVASMATEPGGRTRLPLHVAARELFQALERAQPRPGASAPGPVRKARAGRGN
jgi:DNA-binding MarR family transcriptional regulator